MDSNIFPSPTVPGSEEIREILVRRVDHQKQAVGIVVGIIELHGRRVVAHGHLANGDSRVIDGDTILEIGSVSKVFTSLLLADMVNRNEVTLDDPAATYLPEHVTMPERSGRSITLRDLSTHRSGSHPCPATSSRRWQRGRTRTALTPATAWTICTSSSPATRCRETPVPSSNIQTWAQGCSGICSGTARGPTMRLWSETASRNRSAWLTRLSSTLQ
jgi:hypothetical protein